MRAVYSNIVIIVLIILVAYIYYYCITTSSDGSKESYYTSTFRTYLINLDRRKDRYNRTTDTLKQYGYTDIIRFPAVDGKSLSDEYVSSIVDPAAMKAVREGVRTDHEQLSIGAIGCYLSHINLWKLMVNEKLEYILIFEDDTKPNKTFDQLTSHLKDVPEDWDIFLGGGLYDTSNKINDSICKVSSFFCTHVYFVRNTERLRQCLQNSFPIKKQVDWWMNDLQKEGKLNIYGLTDNSWMQIGEDTDIQTPVI